MPHSATNAERSINYLIEHQCPQCGAPAVLEEADRLFTCEYCRVTSYLSPKGVFRYLLPDKAPEGEEILYFPYWRLKGMMFSCREAGIQHRYIDVSHRAIDTKSFPASVGLRSQALKLKYLSATDNARFLRPSLAFEKALAQFKNHSSVDPAAPIFYQGVIGETSSLIYSPFYGKKRLIDAVTNTRLSGDISEAFLNDHVDDNASDWKIQFLPTLCPHCGWGMEGERDAVVMICRNCASAWHPGKNGFRKLKVAYLPTDEKNVFYLPFWRISARIEGVQLETYADLIHRANLPKVVQKGWDEKPFYFWVTAFKVRPQKFLRLATNLTLVQPSGDLEFDLPDRKLFSPNFLLRDVQTGLKLNLANFIKPPRIYFPKLNDIGIVPSRFLLVWLPFIERHHEFVHPHYKISVLKSHLNLAKGL